MKELTKKRVLKKCLPFIAGLVVFLSVGGTVHAETLPTDTSTASNGCTLVGVEGSYLSGAQEALDRINEIRYEACVEGVKDPRDSSRNLTESDYKAIRWSTDLEAIARIRAAEASVVMGHTRPNGTSCFTARVNNMASYGEVLAWNFSKNMLDGVNQWYEEKTDWIDDTGNVTGHYTQMIDPDNTYVGLASFYNRNGEYYNTTSGEYSTSSKELTQTMKEAVSDCVQTIEVKDSYLTSGLKIPSTSLNAGDTTQAQFTATVNSCKVELFTAISWKSSNTGDVTIDDAGLISGVHEGTATIIATSGSLSANKDVSVSGHLWDDGKVTKEATCAEKGIKTYTCTKAGCGETNIEEITRKPHTEAVKNAAEATCTEAGYTGDTYCTVCDRVIKTGTTINALGHKWDDGEVTTKATCTATGVKTYKCTRPGCTETKTEEIAKIAHTEAVKNAAKATCTEAGYTGDTYCTVCNQVLKTGKIIKALGHEWDRGVVTKKATYTKTGIKTYTCTRENCGETKTENIAKLKIAVGTSATVSGMTYKVKKDGEVTFAKAKKNIKSLSIPATVSINGVTHKVTAVSAKAVSGNKKLKSVTIGANVKSISKNAFYKCSSLKKVTIKTTLLTKKTASKSSFKNANKKLVIKAPKSVKKKYKTVFKGIKVK